MQHIQYIRAKSGAQLVNLRNEVRAQRRNKKTAINSVELPGPTIREIREDTVLINGSSQKIRRLFVSSNETNSYGKLGWVLCCDVNCCMVCLTALSTFASKHHCRACGNVTCSNCSDEKAIVLDIHSVGPVRVCKQCYWGQMTVDAFYNDHLGLVLESSEKGTFTSAQISEDVERPDLRQYGKLKMMSITPSFAIKTRRADRSIVFVNICVCSEVPLTSDLPPVEPTPDLVYLVGGPVKEISVSPEEQAYLDKEGVHTNSIYDVAVHPYVVEDAMRNLDLKNQFCHQVLEFISTKHPEGDFSIFQVVEGLNYVTEHNCSVRSKSPVAIAGTISASNSSDRDSDVLEALHAKLAIPSPLAFRRLHQMVSLPSDCSDRRNGAGDTEYDDYESSPHHMMGEFASMVHSIIKDTNQRKPFQAPFQVLPQNGKNSPSGVHELREEPGVVSSDIKTITFIGTPGFVIKTHKETAPARSNGVDSNMHLMAAEEVQKVFINVLHHSVVDDVLLNHSVALRQSELPLIVVSEEVSHTTDNKGRKAVLYHVAVGSSLFTTGSDIKVTSPVCIRKMIRAVNNKYNETLDLRQYVLPKVKKGYMGEGIELMTYCFHTKPSDPVVALLHDLHTIKEVKQRGGSVVGSVVGSVDCRSYKHIGDEDDDVSELSDGTPDWQTTTAISQVGTIIAGGTVIGIDGKPHHLGRKTTRFSLLHGMQVSNEGRAMLTDEDMTSYVKILTVCKEESDLLKKRAVQDVRALIGWQIMLPSVFSEVNPVVYVVTGVRKNSLRKTEYRLSSTKQDDFWIRLQRSETKKSGEEFRPLRKVVFAHPSAKAVLNAINYKRGVGGGSDKKRYSIF